jgi:hypothetical protein
MSESAGSPVFPVRAGFMDPEPGARTGGPMEAASRTLRRAPGDSGDGGIAFFGRFVMVVSREAEEGKEPISG